MKEREMQELLWNHPDKLLNEPLTQFRWEPSSAIGRADLIFTDRLGRLLVVEVKRGKLARGAINQLVDYFGMVKREFPDKPVELMVVANSIPEERRVACEKLNIDYQEIPEKKFRDVAEEVGYTFTSEQIRSDERHEPSPSQYFSPVLKQRQGGSATRETAWYYWVSPDGEKCLLAFVNAKGSCSVRAFDAEMGSAYKKPKNQRGNYREVYKECLQSAIPLPARPKVNLDKNCKARLPGPVLDELRRQILKSAR